VNDDDKEVSESFGLKSTLKNIVSSGEAMKYGEIKILNDAHEEE